MHDRIHFNASRLLLLIVAVALVLIPRWLPAATIRTVDDKTTSGSITGFENGSLVVKPDDGSPIVKIPLAELFAIELKALAPKPAERRFPGPSSPPVAIARIFGNLLGAGGQATPPSPAETTPETSPEAEPDNASSEPPATPDVPAPSQSLGWEVDSLAGDRLNVTLEGWSAGGLKLKLLGLDDAAFTAPPDRIKALWSLAWPAAVQMKARALGKPASGQDTALVEKDGEVKTVAGVAAGIDGDHLLFKYEGQERQIKLARLVGVVLADRETPTEKSLYQSFTFETGDLLAGRLQAIEQGTATVEPLLSADKQPLKLPLAKLATIDVKSGRLSWLGDLKPVDVVQTPYLDRLMPYRVNSSLAGGPLKLAEGPVTKGIAVHTRCLLAYDLNGQYGRFRARVGFEQPDGKLGRAVVRIVGDGKVLWEEKDLRGDAPKSSDVDISVDKVKSLRLEAEYGPNYDVAGRVIWGEARLIKSVD